MTHSLPFKPSALAACIFTSLNLSLFPPYSLAAEVKPLIQAGAGYSLALRNDGILFQFGGEAFPSLPIPGTVIPPLRPESKVRLTDVVSLPLSNDISKEYQGSGGAMALVTMESSSTNLFTWNPTYSMNAPALKVPNVKEIKTDEQGNFLIFTHTGEVFIQWQGEIVALPGLSDIKKIVAGWNDYVALTINGTVLVGRWDWSTQQFTPATSLNGISGVTDIGVTNIGKNYALTSNGELYMWEWYWDNTTQTYLPSQHTQIGVSGIKKIFSNTMYHTALTNSGEAYQWNWDGNTHTPTTATLVDGISGGITDILGIGNLTVALTSAGEVYVWGWDNTTQTPMPTSLVLNDIKSIIGNGNQFLALVNNGQVYMGWQNWKSQSVQIALINGVMNANFVEIVGWNGYFARTLQGEVYMWKWNFQTDTPTTATLVSGVSGVKQIQYSGSYTALTNQGDIYLWKWDGSTNIPTEATKMNGISHVKEFSQSEGYALAITDQGEVYMWFPTIYDQGEYILLPHNDIAPTPTQVMSGGVSNLSQIRTQMDSFSWPYVTHFLVLTEDKKLYAWEIKSGDHTIQSALQVGGWSDVIAVAMGGGGYVAYLSTPIGSHFLALREEGQLCGWGDNSLRQLGTDAPNPVPVTDPWCGGSDHLGIEDLIVVETTNTIYPLNITKVGNGHINASLGKIQCGDTCTDSYLADSVVTLTATPDLGYLFKEWGGGCTGTQAQTTLTITNITECTATFDVAPLRTLTIQKNGDGQGTVTVKDSSGTTIDCGNHCSEQYLNNSPLTLEIRAHEDSKFAGWNGEGCGNTLTITEDKTCTATFVRLSPKTLSVTKEGNGNGQVVSAPSGIDCGPTCSASFAERSTVKLTAIPDPGSKFISWGGDCGGNQDKTLLMTMNTNYSCTAHFHLPVPNMVTSPSSLKFENVVLGGSRSQFITVRNDGEVNLEIGTATLSGDSVFKLNGSDCTNKKLTPYESSYETRHCLLYVTFYPDSTDLKTATLSIPSNDPDTPVATVPIQGVGGCQGQVEGPWVNYSTFDFGVQKVGQPRSLSLWVYSSTDCGIAPKVNTTELTGNSEFDVSPFYCYNGMWDDKTLATCYMTISFSPTSEGKKEGQLHLTFTDPSIHFNPIPLYAEAKNSDPQIEVSPTQVNFGSLPLGGWASKNVVVKNSGEVNLKLNGVSLTGDPSFGIPQWARCEHYFTYYGAPWMLPGDQCQLAPFFMPIWSFGEKTGTINIHSSAVNAPSLPVPLTGTAELLCLDKNVTIESLNNGVWNDGTTWNHGLPPTNQDVVRIKAGHTITALPYATVKGLCIEPGATLESRDNLGTPLEVYASQYIENKGTILGKAGAVETGETSCSFPWRVGIIGCAQNGSSIFLKSGLSGGVTASLYNEGSIIAGEGGAGKRYGGTGGSVYVSGGEVVNLPNEQGAGGVIRTGKGGNLIGTQTGLAGQGGEAKVSAHGSWLVNRGTSIAGGGGECNPAATESQSGGNGGTQRWWGPSVSLEGTLIMGKGGTQCSPLGTNGVDGDLLVDPNVISLSGASTKIEGGNITIFGGKEWVLNLSHLNAPIIKATGNITLAVGARGAIDLTGNNQVILEAVGQVNIFSDNILLDDGIKLTDLIKAKNIVVGRATILRDVSLVASDHITGQPGTTIPVVVTVSNSGPEEDHYLLNATTQAGWPVNILGPSDLIVQGLSSQEVTLNITIPTGLPSGEMEIITVTATSQTDQKVSDTFDIRVSTATQENPTHPVVAKDSLPPSPSVPAVSPNSEVISPVPTTGTSTATVPNDETGSTHPEKDGPIDPLPVTSPQKSSTPIPFISAPASQPLKGCPPTGTIDFMCDNRGHVISNAVFESKATVAGGELAGVLTNEGFISQVTLQTNTELKGGTLSGFIINHGTLADFQFVGAQIQGGTLAGEITNTSKVGGTLIDVILAPNTHLKGGRLKGKIQGDHNAPALLEDVRVLSGSHLSGVKLGKGVILEKGVIVEEENKEESSKLLLPSLGQASAVDEQGQIVTTSTRFTGGISLHAQNTFSTKQEVNALSDQIEILGHIVPDPNHVGQEVELVVYATYQSSPEEKPISLVLNEEGKVFPWDEKLSSLKPFKEKVVLQSDLEVNIYQGMLLAPGIVRLHFGYRLPEGLLVSHHETIELIVTSL